MFSSVKKYFQQKIVIFKINLFSRNNDVMPVEWQNCWVNISHCLIIWPEQGIDLESAELVLLRLRAKFATARLTIMALPGIGASPLDSTAEILRMKPNDVNFLGIPRQNLIEKMQQMNIDLVIDMSPQFNPLSAYLTLISQARIRVGFVGEEIAEKVFNLLIAPKPEHSKIEKYRVLAKYLG